MWNTGLWEVLWGCFLEQENNFPKVHLDWPYTSNECVLKGGKDKGVEHVEISFILDPARVPFPSDLRNCLFPLWCKKSVRESSNQAIIYMIPNLFSEVAILSLETQLTTQEVLVFKKHIPCGTIVACD